MHWIRLVVLLAMIPLTSAGTGQNVIDDPSFEMTKEKKKAGPSFGLMAPGYFWIDDVSLEKIGDDVPLTEKPVLGVEESPVVPPAEIGLGAVRCAECSYRNMPAWKTCYACGTPLE